MTVYKLTNSGGQPRTIYPETEGRVDFDVGETVEVSEKTFKTYKGHSYFDAVKEDGEE